MEDLEKAVLGKSHHYHDHQERGVGRVLSSHSKSSERNLFRALQQPEEILDSHPGKGDQLCREVTAFPLKVHKILHADLTTGRSIWVFFFFFLIFLFILFFNIIYFNWRLITLQYCIGFAIHQHESAMGVHVFKRILPPKSSMARRGEPT